MMRQKTSDRLCDFAAWLFLGFVATGFVLAIFSYRDANKRYETLFDRYQSQAEYLFDGANKRNLLDICERGGERGVFFKEDCDQPLKR